MPAAAAVRRLGRTVPLTLVATALVFAFDPGRQPQRSWPHRYLDWLGALVRLDFLTGLDDQNAVVSVVRVPYAVTLTMMVAFVAVLVTAVTTVAGTGRRAGRPGRAAPPGPVAIALLALLGWLAGTLGTVAGLLNDAAGADVLPTTVMVPFPGSVDEPLSYVVAQLHQLVFPALVVSVVVVPAAAWWCRRTVTGAPKEAAAAGLRTLADLLPAFVAAALLVELARNSFGTSQLLVGRNVGQWFDDPTSNTATAVLLLGVAVALTQAWFDAVAGLITLLPDTPATTEADGPATGAPAEAPADTVTAAEATDTEPAAAPGGGSIGQLWRRVRAERSARGALVLLVGVGLAVCYARLWFDIGPTDIVSTDAPRPPSAQHWLGVDTLGHDQLTRMAAATVGSALVAAAAATVATLAGLLLTAARLPRRAARAVATLTALTAVVWLVSTFGDPLFSHADPSTRRLELAVALGALVTPLSTRILSGPGIDPGRAVGAWLAAAAAAVPAEQLATLLLVRLDHRSPTLGAALAQAVAGSDPANLGYRVTDPASDRPWLWHPPALVLTVLAVATTLLAAAALTHRRRCSP